jgi:hypothetical protein
VSTLFFSDEIRKIYFQRIGSDKTSSTSNLPQEEEEEEEEEAARENNDPNDNSSVCLMHGIRAWVKAAGLIVVMRERSDSETPEIHIQTAAA